jgi:hypothetical protein
MVKPAEPVFEREIQKEDTFLYFYEMGFPDIVEIMKSIDLAIIQLSGMKDKQVSLVRDVRPALWSEVFPWLSNKFATIVNRELNGTTTRMDQLKASVYGHLFKAPAPLNFMDPVARADPDEWFESILKEASAKIRATRVPPANAAASGSGS